MRSVGYRAMLNTIGSLCGAEDTGILDCVTYTAGVSGRSMWQRCTAGNKHSRFIYSFSSPIRFFAGSCWALGTMYSGVAGSFSPSDAADHLQDRIQKSYLEMDTLDALVTPPTNKVSDRRPFNTFR